MFDPICNFESLQMGSNILYRINYCHLQASVGASRVRYKLKKSCPDKTKFMVIRKVACEVKAVLRQRFHRPSWLKILMPINHGFVTVLPQTFPGASGQMALKMLLQPNGSLSNNLFYIIFYLDTYTRKISNIRFSGTSF